MTWLTILGLMFINGILYYCVALFFQGANKDLR